MSDGARILLVEDEPDVRVTLAEVLVGEGFRVTAVEDLSAAIQSLDGEGTPDIALIDYRLPDGLGSDLYTALRRRDVVARILSAQPRPLKTEVEPDHWISKGITVRALIDLIRSALGAGPVAEPSQPLAPEP